MRRQGPRIPRPSGQKAELTRGEQRVLDILLARPLDSNKDIALTLGCTVKNVEFHMSNILRKTGMTSRMELVMKMLGGHRGKDGAGTGRP